MFCSHMDVLSMILRSQDKRPIFYLGNIIFVSKLKRIFQKLNAQIQFMAIGGVGSFDTRGLPMPRHPVYHYFPSVYSAHASVVSNVIQTSSSSVIHFSCLHLDIGFFQMMSSFHQCQKCEFQCQHQSFEWAYWGCSLGLVWISLSPRTLKGVFYATPSFKGIVLRYSKPTL